MPARGHESPEFNLSFTKTSRGLCVLMLRNLTPRVKELLRITNLLQLFSS